MGQLPAKTDLYEIFHPRSVAIVGASLDERKWGHIILKRLIDKGYQGEIYPVNPKASEIIGYKAYSRVNEIPGTVDTVVIGVNKNYVMEVVKDCVEKRVKGAIVVTAGFRETGQEGSRLENELIEIAKKGGIRIIGPNCAGISCPPANLYLTPNPRIGSGNIAFASQSGNIGNHLVSQAAKLGLGFSNYISVGNQADVDFAEYISYFGQDPDTAVIALYVEGLKNGERFLEVAKEVSLVKPIVLLKGGRTDAGHRAAATHTGSLAGKREIWNAALKQAGVINVQRFDEFFPIIATFAGLKPYVRSYAAEKVVSITDGGGYAVLTADLCTEQGLELIKLDAKVQNQIASLLPAHAPQNANPIDTAGGMDDNPELLADCCEPLFNDSNAEAIMITGIFGGYGGTFSSKMEQIEIATAKRLLDMAHSSGKPLLMQTNYGDNAATIPSLSILANGGIPIFTSLETATRCLKACNDYEKARQRIAENISPNGLTSVSGERREGLTCVSKAEELFNSYSLPVVPLRLATTPEEAVRVAKELGFPVVLKIQSPDISHKTEAGGIVLDLRTPEEIKYAFEEIISKAKSVYPGASISGVTVSPQISNGVEVIVGVVRDELFGPVIMVGLGGTTVELIRDVAFRVCPIDEHEANLMLRELKMFPLLDGFRGQMRYSIDSLSRIISNTSALAVENTNVVQLDFNPVIVTPEEAWIVDVRVVFS